MKVKEAIEGYLSHQRLSGRQPSTVRTTRHALRTVLAPAIEDEVSDLVANAVGQALRTILGQRVRHQSGKPLAKSSQALYLSITRAFLAWCIGKGWLRANPLDQLRHARTASTRPIPAPAPPVPPVAPKHIGEVVRRLREGARLLRRQLAKQVGVAESTLRNIETGRHHATAEILRKLLTAPCMATLPALVKQAGLSLALGDKGV